MVLYLGLDLGTSGLKGVLIDQDQSVVGHSTATLNVQRPHSGWSEQQPTDCVGSKREMKSQADGQEESPEGRHHRAALFRNERSDQARPVHGDEEAADEDECYRRDGHGWVFLEGRL